MATVATGVGILTATVFRIFDLFLPAVLLTLMFPLFHSLDLQTIVITSIWFTYRNLLSLRFILRLRFGRLGRFSPLHSLLSLDARKSRFLRLSLPLIQCIKIRLIPNHCFLRKFRSYLSLKSVSDLGPLLHNLFLSNFLPFLPHGSTPWFSSLWNAAAFLTLTAIVRSPPHLFRNYLKLFSPTTCVHLPVAKDFWANANMVPTSSSNGWSICNCLSAIQIRPQPRRSTPTLARYI